MQPCNKSFVTWPLTACRVQACYLTLDAGLESDLGSAEHPASCVLMLLQGMGAASTRTSSTISQRARRR